MEKDKGNLRSISAILIVFVTLIIGIALIADISSLTNKSTSLTSYTETIDLSSARLAGGTINETYDYILTNAVYSSWRADISDCLVETVSYTNQTGAVVVADTDYTFTSTTAVFNVLNTESMNDAASNTTAVTYNYCDDNYQSGWGATVLKLVPGFFALALLGAALFFLTDRFKDSGVF